MAIAHVTFVKYYDYEVEIDDDLYNKDPWTAEGQAVDDAKKLFDALMRRPITDTTYDAVEIEFE